MNIKDLKKEIPFRWRVQSFSTYKATAICIPYIDSRDAQELLDDVCGSENWQNDFWEVGDKLFCKVGIKCGDEWIWKGDTGTESNIEKAKGHASDAFKRACVHWGIGRFLYSVGHFTAQTNGKKDDKTKKPYVVDLEGKYVFDITAHINKIWDKSNVGGEEVTDLAKRMKEKHISATAFTEKLAQYRIAFENAGREGEFTNHLQDNFSTDNEAQIVKEFLNSAKPIVEAINKLYKGEK